MIAIDRSQLEAQLVELEKAKFALVTGAKAVSATYNGMSTTFTPTSLVQLNAAIMETKAALGLGGRRAIAVGFGCR